jgi:hypothetical protein
MDTVSRLGFIVGLLYTKGAPLFVQPVSKVNEVESCEGKGAVLFV